jgi:hypothetical protein
MVRVGMLISEKVVRALTLRENKTVERRRTARDEWFQL